MKLNSKIYVAGHRGLVGSAIIRQLELKGFRNVVTRTHDELDLINQAQVEGFFTSEKPDYVILAAAKVGGIYANNTYPADFMYQNIMIEANVINSAYKNKVKRLLFLGSTCIYPREASQPMKEDALLTNALEPTNESYAVAKIAGIKLCESYNRQYDTDFRSVMPTNLYGVNDSFHSKNSHVIPSLILRFHKAKMNSKSKVTVWGTGRAMREFMYVDDMASASLYILNLSKKTYNENTKKNISHINIGTGKDITIKELSEIIKKIVGYDGVIEYDNSKLDGAPRKLVDVSRLSKMGWKYSTDIRDGLKKTYEWYLNKNDT